MRSAVVRIYQLIYERLRQNRLLLFIKRGVFTRLFFAKSPTSCSTLKAITQSANGQVFCTGPNTVETYKIPEETSGSFAAFLQSWQQISIPERIVARIPMGRVYADGIVISPDGDKVARDVSIVFSGDLQKHPITGSPFLFRAKRFRGRLGVAASAAGHTYFHWLFDVVPRLWQLEHHEVDAVYVQYDTTFAKDWLSVFPFKHIASGAHTHYIANELIVPSLQCRTGHPTREVCDRLRTLALRFPRPAQNGLEKIYVSRRNANYRRLSNEAEIIDALQARGFVCVEPSQLTVAEQISLFSTARVVVAPHGAGLANVVFCRPGTQVVELMNRTAAHWCYWQLCVSADLHYAVVLSPGNDTVAHMTDAATDDFCVDPDSVLQKIHEIGSCT